MYRILLNKKQRRNFSIVPEKQTIITSANDSELENMGTILLKINIQGTKYEIKAYVLKGLTCRLLLGNNFCLKYGLVIHFKKKEIRFYTGDNINNIKMDKIWAEHNGPPTILYKTEEEDKMTNEHIIQKIIVTEDTLMPPKILTNIKIETNIGALDEQSVIHPVDRLSQKHYLKLETNKLGEKTTEIQLYNFSNLYTKVYKGTVIGTTEYYTKKDNLLTINKTNNDVCDKQGTIIKISKDLTNEQAEKAKALIRKFQHLFTSEQLDLNCARVEECEVKLSSKDPVFQAPYRVSPKQREKLKEIINEMINADIIEPSKSSYAAPVFLIPKKQKGEYRFLVDFRKLNEQTINDRHPIPRSQDIFRALEGGNIFQQLTWHKVTFRFQ